jgi:hypothetical protein
MRGGDCARGNFSHRAARGLEKIINFESTRMKTAAAKSQIAFLLSLTLLLAGCAANNEKIVFSDEHSRTQDRSVAAAVPAPPKKLNKRDLIKVELAIYSYLLQRHFWDDGEYSAIFLQGDDAEVSALIKKFPNHVPPIKPDYRAELRPGRTPVDKESGKPAMVLSVDALDPEGDTVQAIGRWFAGDAVTGFYSFDLKKSGGDWEIENVK